MLDILKDLPVQVDCVDDGEEAVGRVAIGGYDLVLMDIQMPRMGGVAAAQAIRGSKHDDRNLPIIAVTAHATESDKARFLAAGMDDYLAKPVDVDALIALVRRYLNLESDEIAAAEGLRA
jgi:CheY-like chemotaxis protein